MRRKAVVLAFVAVAALAALYACDSLLSPTTVVQVDTHQNVPASPSPSASACLAPAFVAIKGPSSLVVGASEKVELTPYIAPGVPSPAACDNVRNVQWNSPGAACALSGAGYVVDLKGAAAGSCEVSARVDGVTSEKLVVAVTP